MLKRIAYGGDCMFMEATIDASMHEKAKTAFRRLGASNHADSERQGMDYYATEPSAIEEKGKSIW